MDIIIAIVEAIVQGLTEFLPVSSSGHLALVQHFTGFSPDEATFLSAVVHLGTLVAVFIAFWERIKSLIIEFFDILKDVFTLKFSFKNMSDSRKMIIMLLVAIIPLFIILPIKSSYDALVLQGGLLLVGICFLITSLLLYISDRAVKGHKDIKDISYKNSLAIGIAQTFAVLPGISRSGSTIATGLLCGLSKQFAVEFSFILGIPAILGAGLISINDAIKTQQSIDILPVVIAFIVSAITGFLAIKMIKFIIKSNKFRVFAYYTGVLGILTIGMWIFDKFK